MKDAFPTARHRLCKSYVLLSLLCGKDVLWISKNEMDFLDREFHYMTIYGVQLKDTNRVMDFMQMLCSNETIDPLSGENSVLVWVCVEEVGCSCHGNVFEVERKGD